ncbi:hypothetical protein HUU61_01935 [Rhodopseudomonas palustris]|nr:hypothetical protein [Rhodopseudomonas palustris]
MNTQPNDQTPSDEVPWDKDFINELDSDARADRASEQFDRDYAIATRAVERFTANRAGAHKRCPLKRCRRARSCRSLIACVVLRIDQPTDAQREVIDQVYEHIQRRRMHAATAARRGGESTA